MNDDKKIIKTTKRIYPQIYSYILPDIPANKGWQKVGYTERKDVDSRILEQTKTAAVKLRYEKLWSASSFSNTTHEFFKDKDLHKYYVKNGIEKSKKQDDGGLGEEWFYFNGTPEKSKELFDDYANGNLFSRSSEKSPYKLRKEQDLTRLQIFLHQIKKRNFYGTQNRVSVKLSLLTILQKSLTLRMF